MREIAGGIQEGWKRNEREGERLKTVWEKKMRQRRKNIWKERGGDRWGER